MMKISEELDVFCEGEMIKIVLILIVVGGFTYVGFGISSYYKKRADFFAELMNLCDKVRAEIDFSGKNLTAIFENQKYEGNLGKVVQNFVEYLKNNDVNLTNKQLFHGVRILKDEEKSMIFDFFARLGRHDSNSEVKLIDDFKNLVEPHQKLSNDEKIKFGKMSVKVSFLLGLMVAILIV